MKGMGGGKGGGGLVRHIKRAVQKHVLTKFKPKNLKRSLLKGGMSAALKLGTGL